MEAVAGIGLTMAVPSIESGSARAVLLSALDVSQLIDTTYRAVTKACAAGRIQFLEWGSSGNKKYCIPLANLPTEAQAKYWIQQYHDTFRHDTPREQRFAWFMALNLDPEGGVFSPVYKAAGLHIDPMAWTDEESEQRHEELFKMKTFAKETARERAQLVRGFAAAKRRAPEGLETQAGMDYAQGEGKSYATLARWHKLVKHLELKDWEPALTPGWKGGRSKVDIHFDVWQTIRARYLVESQPTAKSVYQHACRWAEQHGHEVPSYRIVLARLKSIDRPVRVKMREGKTAFDNLFRGIIRDYSTLELHEQWNADGRKADVMCVWPDGHVGRPITLQWLDSRSRYPLGVAFGKGENVDMVRKAYRNAVEHAGCLPQFAYLDNGAAFASKEFTGGQTKRNRFKVKQTEVTGILTLTGVKAVWATPGRGQVKHIESFWNVIARGVDQRAEFAKAYCGKDTVSRPEGSNPIENPIPIEDYIAAYMEELEAFKLRSHRGNGMDAKSPKQVYTDLQAHVIQRKPTKEQLSWCMLVAESVMLSKRDGSFTINGNVYWHEKLPKLESTGPYTARYDGEDSRVAPQLFDGETFICHAELRLATGARNLEAAKDGIRAKKQQKKAYKDLEKGIKAEQKARRWDVEAPPAAPAANDVATLLASKVVTPMRATKNYKPVNVPSPKVSPEQRALYRLNETANLAAREAQFEKTGFTNLQRQAGSKR